jgi:copper/silver efflux system protein
VPVTASNGAQIPLGQVTDLGVVMGPSMISSENGLLRGSVLMNVRGRDVGQFVDEAQRAVAREVKIPPGYTSSGEDSTKIRSVPKSDSNSSSRSCS